MHLVVHGDAVGKKVFHRYQDVIADVVIIKKTNTTFGGTASKASGATHVQLVVETVRMSYPAVHEEEFCCRDYALLIKRMHLVIFCVLDPYLLLA